MKGMMASFDTIFLRSGKEMRNDSRLANEKGCLGSTELRIQECDDICPLPNEGMHDDKTYRNIGYVCIDETTLYFIENL